MSAFMATMIEFSGCDRDKMARKAQNIYYPALYRRGLLNPSLGHYQLGFLLFAAKCTQTETINRIVELEIGPGR